MASIAFTMAHVQETLQKAEREVSKPRLIRGFKNKKGLTRYNHSIAKVEAQLVALTPFIQKAEKDKLDITKDLKQCRDALNAKLDTIMGKKATYVKRAFPDNPAYAMARPITMAAGSVFWTATSKKGLEDRLFKVGFSWFEDETAPATCYAKEFVHQEGRWENEMGEKGFYFSKDTPDYLTEGEKYGVGLKCVLDKDMHGVAMMPISKLNARSFGFSKEEVDKAYRTMQKEYSLIKCDETISTEYVFMRPENTLKPSRVVTHSDRKRERTVDDFFEKRTDLHKTWIQKPKEKSRKKTTSNTAVLTGLAVAAISLVGVGVGVSRLMRG